MKFLIIFFSLFVITVQSQDLNTVRSAYKEAAQNKAKIDDFYQMLSKVTKQDRSELIAYKGAAIALQSKYAKTVKEKKQGFIEGVEFVEFAIKKDPNNIENRFIRLGIQENTPKLLKYKDQIDGDKLFLQKQYKNITSSSLKNHIEDYILQSKVFTDEEKTLILKL